ncbi:MAG: Amuc_1100 family pilus-like protein [Akkermansiaceae bacterium]|nr:Amuc_1100 family pilus-like protein [Akkermansiaceae bacterium]
MNWIKQNTFLFGLGVTTLVGAIILWFLGSSAASRYEEAKEAYDKALQDASRYEKLDPYPSKENLQGKRAEIEKYAQQVEKLQEAFDPYRPGDLENISVQEFSANVKKANRETREAFGKNVSLPEDYYCGFEAYRGGALPPGNATSVLNYQLEAVKKLIIDLAQYGDIKLINVHRPRLPEEEGKKFEPEKGQVIREMPVELVFEGSESSVRKFFNTVVNDQDHFLVLRSFSIANEKQQPPRKGDARFEGRRRGGGRESGAPAAPATPNFDELFAPDPGGAVPEAVEGEEAEAQPEGAPAAPPAPEPAPAPARSTDDSRILYQVLGEEDLQVFMRIDLLLFLEARELP